MSTKITTGKCRLSYVTIFEPRAAEAGAEPKYSITLLIPKSDTTTVEKIKSAISEAADNFRRKNGTGSLPNNPMSPLHDGDGVKPNSGEPYGPECKGCYVLNASSKIKPRIKDSFGNDCDDPGEIYSGCYGLAVINFYGYSNRRKGVGCGLLGVKKLAEGEPFGMVATDDDFNEGDDDDFSC